VKIFIYGVFFSIFAMNAGADIQAKIFEKGDAGSSVLNSAAGNGAGASGKEALAAPGMQVVRGTIHALGGGVRGFGVLARYPAPGPKELRIQRKTTFRSREPYAPVSLFRVLDPTGKTILVLDMTGQHQENQDYVASVPSGPAGVYSISCNGGRQGDDITIQFPETPVWGVRGEMSLKPNATIPNPAYLYLPGTVKRLALERFGGNRDSVQMMTENGDSCGIPEVQPKSGSRQVLQVDAPQPDSVVKLSFDLSKSFALLLDGVPGLLCPSAKIARELKGGTEEAAGLMTAGPLQARARRWMAACSPESLEVKKRTFDFDPQTIDDPISEAQNAGVLSNVPDILAEQNLDRTCPLYGSNKKEGGDEAQWEAFRYSLFSPWYLTGLAVAAGLESPVNPYYKDPAVIRRACLAAFVNLAALQGDGLIRENFLGRDNRASYPIIHAFFVYGSLADNYAIVKDVLDPEAREIWRDGLIQIGDRLADYQGYQSNQWTHNLLGHLETYRVTGEKRFLSFFEKQVTAYLDCAWGLDSKFGQHPTGFYLEQYGADGNYGQMNAASITKFYYIYKHMPGARPELVVKIRDAIEKNLAFKSHFWLPKGDAWFSPTAFCSRRPDSSVMWSNPAGDFLASREFDWGATRASLSPMPNRGFYPASVFAYYATTEEWSRRLLTAVKEGEVLRRYNSIAHRDVFRAVPQTAKVMPLPCQQDDYYFERPGVIAANRKGIYSLCFYDVAGASKKARLLGFMGGGPTAVCTDELGTVMASMAPYHVHNKVTEEDHLTFSCVYGRDKQGSLLFSSKERAMANVLEAGKSWEISAEFAGGTLTWRYTYDDAGLTVGVFLKDAQLADARVNLPVLMREGLKIAEQPGGVMVSNEGKASLFIEMDPAGTVSSPLIYRNGKFEPVQCLRIPLSAEGKASIRLTRPAQ
jgi:hypothetical protein